jgi:putative DNA primase/helicase
MDFRSFCQLHGLVLKDLIGDGRWHRVSTTDKPSKKNGSYSFRVDHGFAINFATMSEADLWQEKSNKTELTPAERSKAQQQMMAAKKAAERQDELRKIEQQKAAELAVKRLRDCELKPHSYLAKKGFPDELGLVDAEQTLWIPMRNYHNYTLVQGAQRITKDLEKKFFWKADPRYAVFVFDRDPAQAIPQWFVEGYATGLSLRAALKAIYQRAEVVVCFTAGNLKRVAPIYKSPRARYVFADNDQSRAGQEAAEATDLPWIMPPTEGMDANDYHQANGIQALAKLLREFYAMRS